MEAKFIKKLENGVRASQNLYKMNPPYQGNKYVILSKSTYMGGETYIFPSNEEGQILDWLELQGSMRGNWSDSEILEGINYEEVHD